MGQANPSQAEAIYRDFKSKKAKLTTKKKVDVSEKYGNAASAEKPEDELLLGQTEVYREYDASGAPRTLPPSPSHATCCCRASESTTSSQGQKQCMLRCTAQGGC